MKKLSLNKISLSVLFSLVWVNIFMAQEPNKQVASKTNTSKCKIGVLGSNFIKFKTDEMLDLVKRLNVRYLSVKENHLPFESTDEQIAEFQKKLNERNVVAYCVGLFYLNKKEEVDRVFEYAKRVGVGMIVGTPQHDLLPYIEEQVKKYNLKFAIHIHGGDIPLYPNTTDVFGHIKNLDHRIGICLDMSHEMRTGNVPSESLKKYKDRIMDIHLKDVTAGDKLGKSCVMGQGVINIPLFIKTLQSIGYTGVCSLELEENRNDALPGLAESKGYFEGVEDMLIRKY